MKTGSESLESVDDDLWMAGGGLISGVAIAAKALKPSIEIIAAEPSGADDAARSKAAGHLVQMLHPNTIADGLRASLGDLTWWVECQIHNMLIMAGCSLLLETENAGQTENW